jgi:hypothetical protein
MLNFDQAIYTFRAGDHIQPHTRWQRGTTQCSCDLGGFRDHQ